MPKKGLNPELINAILYLLECKGELPQKYRPHILKGNWIGYWECHIQPDWLLIWQLNEDIKFISLIRTGTHSDLF